MKLYYAPGACSLGIHVMLEEIGKPYETQLVNLREGEQHKPEFTAVNPKSKVPTLVRDDGSVLTEFPAIAFWLARTNPDSRMLPDDVEAATKALEMMDFVVATMHMQGFTRIFRPGNFSPTEADADRVKARGTEIFTKGFGLIDQALEGRDWVVGSFSAADCALFYVESWAKRLNIPMPANCAAHYQRMCARPAVQTVLAREGLAA